MVHLDEKTPHMHLSFVPLTKDGRLSAKDIVGNRARLQKWQDDYWKHMVQVWPDLERGESASETGRNHIPPRVFKEMTRLDKQREHLEQLLSGINALNAKAKAAEIAKFLDSYIPNVEKMHTQVKQLEDAKLRQSYEAAVQLLERIPPEIVEAYQHRGKTARRKESAYEKC